MLTTVFGAKCIGIDAIPVTVEINITSGIGIHLVGLADIAVKESLLRTITALQSMGFRIPGKKIVINLAPADLHKKGSGYDLPIALGIIAASGQADLPGLKDYLIMGELGLDGTTRSIPGALPIAELASRHHFKGCIIPRHSAMETSELKGTRIYGIDSITDAISILSGKAECSHLLVTTDRTSPSETRKDTTVMDFEDIIGQAAAKRAAEIAAAGNHNLLLIGPPGAGKSSIANAIINILPPMTHDESIQTSKIYSVAGKAFTRGLMKTRPFRSPHHTSSMSAMIGGGSDLIMPGEISLANNGILFIDEFCEAPKKLLEALRGPMEDRRIVISRLRMKVEFPCSFMLVAATNPCPCGYYGEGDKCVCSPGKRAAYLSKLSGPLMDRIDIQVWIHPVPPSALLHKSKEESSLSIAKRVMLARQIQYERFRKEGIFTNSEMTPKMLDKYCPLDQACRELLETVMDKAGMSARAGSKIIKLARTIADLDKAETITTGHLSEAVSYRFLDKHL